MKKLYSCNLCKARFEADDSVFENPLVRCPECGRTHARNEYAEVNFCPHCRRTLQFPLDLPAGQFVTCPKCSGSFHTAGTGAVRGPETDDLLPPGALFDKFRIIRRIGRGGMGAVYLVEHRLLKRECALKVLFQDNAADSKYAARFVQEAKLGNRIRHPNLVEVYDVGTDLRTGRLFIAMEYVNGESLSQLLKKRKFSETEILQIGIEVCKALEAMAAAGIVHRDIKPSNIMMNGEGQVKLTDLGVAKSADRRTGDVTLTQGREIFGTPEYASPEQCQASHLADHKSDLYSLGATLFHLASGVPPYDGATALEIILKVLKEPPQDLQKLAPELSAGFIQLIREMMQRDPAARPADAAAVRDRMEKLLIAAEKAAAAARLRRKLFCGAGIAAGILLLAAGLWLWKKAYSESAAGKTASVKSSSPPPTVPVPAVSREKVRLQPVVPVRKQSQAVPEKKPEIRSVPSGKPDIAAVSGQDPVLDEVLAERLAECDRKLAVLSAVQTKDPDRQQWNAYRCAFLQKQQILLREQLENRKFAIAVSLLRYSAKNTRKVRQLVKKIRELRWNRDYSAMVQELEQLIRNPETDPNLRLPGEQSGLLRNAVPGTEVSLLEFLYHGAYSGESGTDRTERYFLWRILLDRHVLIPDSFSVPEPEFIRYGIARSRVTAGNAELLVLAGHTLWPGISGKEILDVQRMDCRYPWRIPPLHYAVMKGWRNVVMQLLLCGTEVNATDEQGQSALHWAVKYDHRELLELLLAAGCDPGIRDRKDRKYTDCESLRQLYKACLNRDCPAVRTKIRTAEEADILLADDLTLLQHLCRRAGSCADAIRFLLDCGADPGLAGLQGLPAVREVHAWLDYYCCSPYSARNAGSGRHVFWTEYTDDNAEKVLEVYRKLLEMRPQDSCILTDRKDRHQPSDVSARQKKVFAQWKQLQQQAEKQWRKAAAEKTGVPVRKADKP